MLKRISIIGLLLSVVLAAAGLLFEAVGPPTETQIYAAYLRRAFEAVEVEGDRQIVINDRTFPNQDYLSARMGEELDVELARWAPKVTARSLKALVEAGAHKGKLNPYLDLLVWHGPKLRVVKDAELQEMFSDRSLGNAWQRYYRTYPKSNGFISFSRVGFDPAANQAVFFVGHACGGLCGSGFLVVMERSWGKWNIVEAQRLWIS